MVPPEYQTYFMTMAAVGATLFGLIFVAISIASEGISTINAPLERQIKATASYIALLNPLMISLFALVPHQQIGIAVISLSSVGLFNTLGMTLNLWQKGKLKSAGFRNNIFILGGFFLYGFETYVANHLLQTPIDNNWFFALADLLIIISAFGIIRAWELIGIRQFHIRDWLGSINIEKKGNGSKPHETKSAEEVKKDRH